eukprot:gene10944-12166_t
MSSLRNAVKRVTHKERAQPESRKRLGLLEKHKDYVERATDFKKKRKILTSLRKKADERNPDEFYHHMHNSRVRDGRHQEVLPQDSNNSLASEMLHLLQSQDLGYLTHKKAVDDKKILRLKDQLHLIGDVSPKSHKIFVEKEDDVDRLDLATHFNTLPHLLQRVHNRPRLSQIEAERDALATKKRGLAHVLSPQAAQEEQEVFADKRKKPRLSPELAEIKARSKRVKKINEALTALNLKRQAMQKGHKVKVIVKDKVVGYKFRRERSR